MEKSHSLSTITQNLSLFHAHQARKPVARVVKVYRRGGRYFVKEPVHSGDVIYYKPRFRHLRRFFRAIKNKFVRDLPE